jgi:hypothetical protein
VTPELLALSAFICIFGGALLGMAIQRRLPEHHLKPESRDSVKVVAGLIATMAALVLGILVGAAKGSFDTVNTSVTQAGSSYIYLDRLFADYGPETAEMRAELKDAVKSVIARLWPEEMPDAPAIDPAIATAVSGDMEKILEQLRGLAVRTPQQEMIRTEKLKVAYEIMQYRWSVLEEAHRAMSPLLFGMLLFWITTLNVTYGLFAPRNGTVIAVLFVCALSVAGALFLVEEMGRPLSGHIKVSSEPFQRALKFMGE